ncbi:AraC family transcriptional regulator [Pedobacter yulinensis]|uniref:AraC family transcriptional regulator n=1 Tax=Pedobacter yulinensis TaxID=2126353 RepID=A0A2T3HL12_9SPHI|nr:helix-turn-helix transcriptional regulator [Pedobacter yulinensis]PST83114.1 AraC family transcriptional regulator [Pedobacter yulinensis]
MNFRIIEPGSDLSALVKCYWVLESSKEQTPQKNTIVPDGCMKMIFHYGDPYRHLSDTHNSVLLPRCFVIGQLTKPYLVQPTGKTGTFFVCFHPNGFLPFSSMPIKAMENTAVPLLTLFGKQGQQLEHRILAAQTAEERIDLVEPFLLGRLTDTRTVDHLIRSAVETILTANGQLSVNALSSQAHTHRRQLVRKFAAAIGLSPKQLSKTVRLQAALKTLLTEDVPSLTQLAYQNEYYDQAHFIKDFREFTGLTPKEFYGDRLKMSLIFDTVS